MIKILSYVNPRSHTCLMVQRNWTRHLVKNRTDVYTSAWVGRYCHWTSRKDSQIWNSNLRISRPFTIVGIGKIGRAHFLVCVQTTISPWPRLVRATRNTLRYSMLNVEYHTVFRAALRSLGHGDIVVRKYLLVQMSVFSGFCVLYQPMADLCEDARQFSLTC